MDLPYAVNDQCGSAKFEKNRRELCVRLPVKEPTKDESGVFDKIREEVRGSSNSPVDVITDR